MTQETLEKAWEISSEINYLKNPDQFGNKGNITPETISKMTQIELISNNMRLVFDQGDEEFMQLKSYFMGNAARTINRIAELEKQLSEL